jgi:hypothetical protein
MPSFLLYLQFILSGVADSLHPNSCPHTLAWHELLKLGDSVTTGPPSCAPQHDGASLNPGILNIQAWMCSCCCQFNEVAWFHNHYYSFLRSFQLKYPALPLKVVLYNRLYSDVVFKSECDAPSITVWPSFCYRTVWVPGLNVLRLKRVGGTQSEGPASPCLFLMRKAIKERLFCRMIGVD